MSIAAAVYAHLAANPTVKALVGKRIYHGIAPSATLYPLIQFTQVAGQRFAVLHGERLRMPTIQIDVYCAQGAAATAGIVADTHLTQANVIAAAVEAAMATFDGVVASVRIVNCFLEGEREAIEEGGTLARVSQDYEVWWGASA